MGNQRNLVRTLGMGYVIIFVVANIIGSGVYKKIAPMAAELDSSVWILMAWVVGGIITLFGALSNAEVAGLLADTGGVMFISLLILVTTLGCTNASILTGARPYYAMAREKLFFSGIPVYLYLKRKYSKIEGD